MSNIGDSIIQHHEREQAMRRLRADLNASRCTTDDIARKAGISPPIVSTVLMGRFPMYGGNRLTKKVQAALEELGFDLPECIKNHTLTAIV